MATAASPAELVAAAAGPPTTEPPSWLQPLQVEPRRVRSMMLPAALRTSTCRPAAVVAAAGVEARWPVPPARSTKR
jgi:hypothetical protein